MRELRQPTLLRVFFVCIYRCPVCLCSLELATRSVPLPLFGEKVRLQVIPRAPKLVRFYSVLYPNPSQYAQIQTPSLAV